MISREYWDITRKEGELPIKKTGQISDFAGSSWYTGLIKRAIEQETLPPHASPLSDYFHGDETYSIGYSDEGEKSKFLNHNLPAIAKAISNSKDILDLEEDWDDEGANTTNLSTYNRAISFVRNYCIKIFQSGIKISTPSIEILRDGSIGVNWETSKASFLIVFDKANENISYCYGKNKTNGIPFKTGIENDNSIDESVASWMKKNLRK
jgi:hypothetical protein